MLKTSLFEEHQKLSGKIIDFGGWALPVQYTGLMDEHINCRTNAGIFDVSHMGEFLVEGNKAKDFINSLITNDLARLEDGQALYSVLCNDQGGIIDDLIVYQRTPSRFLVVVNASRRAQDWEQFSKMLPPGTSERDIKLQDKSMETSMIALQGPKAAQILRDALGVDASALKPFQFLEKVILDNFPSIISRTGYTGEDGFEIYLEWNHGPALWQALMKAGASHGLKPCGLGARDTLRLEMKYPLYGQDLTEQTNPLEAGLGWTVKLNKAQFVGKDALTQIKASGIKRKLVGFQMIDRGIPRSHYLIKELGSGQLLGEVTSGTHSPSLNSAIGVGYVDLTFAKENQEIGIEVRGQILKAKIVSTPFYKGRNKSS